MSYPWRKRQVVVLIIIIALIVWYNDNPSPSKPLVSISGNTMGTTYSIKYLNESDKNYKKEIDSVLVVFNNALSTYIPNSEISRLNEDSLFEFESNFTPSVMKKSEEIFKRSEGAFDPTVGPLVNAWGFGFSERDDVPDSVQVDSLLRLVGFEKIKFDENMVQKPLQSILDFSAIAKGYGVDVIAEFLESERVFSYFIEIGGEIRCNGNSDKKRPWRVGITIPHEANISNEIQAVISLENKSLATSGNYRNYYEKDGKRYAHTIDPITGFPVEHSLLSVSVVAKDCMTADAWATAFMVMGLDKAKNILENEDVEAYFIFADSSGKTTSFSTKGIQKSIISEG
ncbi:MAG: FAD:protein FMN transferase [Bacteroidota bacterium]